MRLQQATKRAIDVTVALALLAALSPLLLAVSLLILLLEGRPVFYVSRRHVAIDRCIPVLKFRSMVRDATSPKYRLAERFMRDGYLDIPRDCEVYTPIGRFIERWQIVELPQLVNVVVHGMSLIGNRPLPAGNLALLGQFDGWQRRFDSPAGLSGIAQVVGRLALQPPERLALETGYSRVYRGGNVLACDLRIALYTLRFIFLSKGATLEQAMRIIQAEAPAPAPARAPQIDDDPVRHHLAP